jgi:hypothetical protein
MVEITTIIAFSFFIVPPPFSPTREYQLPETNQTVDTQAEKNYIRIRPARNSGFSSIRAPKV